MSTAVLNILAARKIELCGLLDKHYAAPHHQNMRKEYLMPHIILEMLRIEQQTYAARAA